MSEFIKVGERIINKPTGLDYDLVNGKVYNLKWDRYNGVSYFEEDGSLSLPAKVYTTKSDDIFIKRVNTYFQKTSKLSTGVMLSGIKGTGKTVMAKVIAKNSNLPILQQMRIILQVVLMTSSVSSKPLLQLSLMRQINTGIQKICQDGLMVYRLMLRNQFCLLVITKIE